MQRMVDAFSANHTFGCASSGFRRAASPLLFSLSMSMASIEDACGSSSPRVPGVEPCPISFSALLSVGIERTAAAAASPSIEPEPLSVGREGADERNATKKMTGADFGGGRQVENSNDTKVWV